VCVGGGCACVCMYVCVTVCVGEGSCIGRRRANRVHEEGIVVWTRLKDQDGGQY